MKASPVQKNNEMETPAHRRPCIFSFTLCCCPHQQNLFQSSIIKLPNEPYLYTATISNGKCPNKIRVPAAEFFTSATNVAAEYREDF